MATEVMNARTAVSYEFIWIRRTCDYI